MPRGPRKTSSTGNYHITLIGQDARDLFFDDNDRGQYLKLVVKAAKTHNIKIYAYCLMDNHVHIVAHTRENLSKIMHRINLQYALFHNKKYRRTGHLLADRFTSIPIESRTHLIYAITYTHKNPLAAGFVSDLTDHKWSSYRFYYTNLPHPLISRDHVIDKVFSSLTAFQKLAYASLPAPRETYEPPLKLSDGQVREKILDQLVDPERLESLHDPLLDRNQRHNLIREVTKLKICPYPQLARVLGIGYGLLKKIAASKL